MPSESSFSRAMAEFARSKVFEKIHATLVLNGLQRSPLQYLCARCHRHRIAELLARPKSAGKKAESVRKPAAEKRGNPNETERRAA